jgi:two-component system response regulator AlgR
MSLNILIVDDDRQARQRMRQLLSRCPTGLCGVVEEAADAGRAAGLMRHRSFDLLLLDVQMPDESGLTLASSLRYWPQRPAVVFVTGHAEHALEAFELDAVDYLTKPVRPERLERALRKALGLQASPLEAQNDEVGVLRIVQRGQTQRLLLSEVLYLRAEGKRLTAVTPHGRFLLDGALVDLEQRYASELVRVHRHTLAVHAAITMLRRIGESRPDHSGWELSLRGTDERLPVARRLVSQLRSRLLLQEH